VLGVNKGQVAKYREVNIAITHMGMTVMNHAFGMEKIGQLMEILGLHAHAIASIIFKSG
jgi:flagellar biosynthesis protein FlhB